MSRNAKGLNQHTLVQKLYQEVIDDLVKNMKQEFENEGVDDQILQELQNLWEIKLLELTKMDEDPDDDTVVHNPEPAGDPKPSYMYPHQGGSQPQEYSTQPLPYPHPQPTAIQAPIAYSTGDEVAHNGGSTSVSNTRKEADRLIADQVSRGRGASPALGEDGDDDDDNMDDMDADGPKAARPKGERRDLDAEDLGDDLDSSGDDEPEPEDLVLCQFEKVTRTKNKWKTTLKDGVMRLNGRDYVFHKGLGEFEW